jgi:hypothetical protein
MGLLDGTSQNSYYTGNSFGNYQFVTIDDIVNQFMISYVGENKIIPKIKKTDVAFWAQRALQELSFDTFKSFKSQQIDLPPSLIMPLPHDYVNYTKISWSDGSGIKHPLYPTNSTSNPYQIKQHSNGNYFFGLEGSFLEETNLVQDSQFDFTLDNNIWSYSEGARSGAWTDPWRTSGNPVKYYIENIFDEVKIIGGQLEFKQLWQHGYGISGPSRAYAVWQKIDVRFEKTVDLKATATSGDQQLDGVTLLCDYGVVRVGLTSQDPNIGWVNPAGNLKPATATPPGGPNEGINRQASNYDIGYLEWADGTTSMKEIENIDVTQYDYIWVYIQSYSPWTTDSVSTITNTYDHDNDPSSDEIAVPKNGSPVQPLPLSSTNNTFQTNVVDFISVITEGQKDVLTENSLDGNSSTWNNYKSSVPSENNNDNYEDDTYWPYDGRRYGLDPQHAQVNGSFFIDDRLGKIHFSSNVSGKTVILDYISDSLGTTEEMQVHKLAEDAMYKWIAHAIISTSSYGQNLAPRFAKEKFAAVRKAKLRLSNIKLEEIVQVLRGKSKQIKH